MLRRRRVVQALGALACPAATALAAASGWNPDRLREAEGHAHRLRSSAELVLHRGEVVFRFGEPALPVNLCSGRKSVASVRQLLAARSGVYHPAAYETMSAKVERARDIVVVHGTDHRRWLRASPELGQLAPLLERIFAALPAGA